MNLLTIAALAAQTASVPPNLILPNYERVPIGQKEGIEAGAFLARTNDAASNWYNPAGLGRSLHTAVNATATAYEWTSMSLEGFGASEGRSRINTIGTLLGVVLGDNTIDSGNWRLGFAITKPISWRPSSIDFAFTLQSGDELMAYMSDVDFTVQTPALGIAFSPGGVATGTFRVGAGLGLAMTSLSQNQGLSDRITTPTTAVVAGRTFSAEGSTWHLQPSLGVQWDASTRIKLGGQVVAPSLRVRGSSRLTLQKSRFDADSSRDLVFRDEEAEFDYKQPLQASVGAAYVGPNAELEVDVRYYGAIDTYDLYASDVPGQLTSVDGGGPPVETTVPFVPTPNSARSIVNVAVGGSYRLSQAWRVHVGFSTDRSPVDDETQSIFRKVDLSRITGGVSLTGSRLSGSLGLGYSFGSGTRETLGSAESGLETETQFSASTFNLLFSFSYSFD